MEAPSEMQSAIEAIAEEESAVKPANKMISEMAFEAATKMRYAMEAVTEMKYEI